MKTFLKTFLMTLLSIILILGISLGTTYAVKPDLVKTWFGIEDTQTEEPTDDTEKPDDGNLGDVDIPLPGGDDGEIEVPIDPGEDEEPDEEPEIKVLDFTFSDGVLTGYTGSETEIVIPSSYSIDSEGNFIEGDDYTVTEIGDYVFNENKTIEKVVFPSTITSIGYFAFNNCENLQEVDFSQAQSLELIDYNAFSSNINLGAVNLPDSVTTINEYAFRDCQNVTSLTLPSSLIYIGDGAFEGFHYISNLDLPSDLQFIGDNAFQSIGWFADSSMSITLPASLNHLGNGVFSNGNIYAINVDESNSTYASVDGVVFSKDLTTLLVYPKGKLNSYVIPETVTAIGDYAFYSCDLTQITIPETVTSIGDYAFGDNGFENILIPSSVTSIGSNAFVNCISLKNITIPSNVTYIGETIFMYCSQLETITFESLTPSGELGENYTSALVAIYVPAEAVESYKTAEGWSQYADIIEAITEVSIGDEETPGDDDIVEIG